MITKKLLTSSFLVFLALGSLQAQTKSATSGIGNPGMTINGQYLLQMEANANIEARLTAEILVKRYSLKQSDQEMLSKILLNKRMAVERIIMGPDGNKNRLIYDEINKADSLLQNYPGIKKTASATENNTKFAAAVRLKEELKLNAKQVDSLLSHASRLKSMMNAGLKQPKEYEKQVLPKILNDAQYTALLISLNKSKAETWAKGAWKELKERKMTNGLDSAETVKSIYGYNIYRAVKSERAEYINGKMSTSLQALEVEEPEPALSLKHAKRYNNPIPGKTSASSASKEW